MLRFKYFILFGTQTLFDTLLSVLKLPTHLSKLNEIG